MQDVVIAINLNGGYSNYLHTFLRILSEEKIVLAVISTQKIINMLVVDFKVSAFEDVL